jgi:hypothetical protein
MQIEFSLHALSRMRERGVSRDEVINTLSHPLRTVEAGNERLESQGWIDRADKRMLLRVICEHGVVITVVTVIATSRYEKYGVVP